MRTPLSRRALAALTLIGALWAPAALADESTFELTIRDHRFQPEEFESYKLNREKVIPGNSTATVYIGPLDAGTYPFVGEFNQKTAKGSIVAK